MSDRWLRWISLWLCGLVLSTLPVSGEGNREPEWIAAQEMSHTAVVAHTDAALEPGKNTVYCPSFQLAWDRLKDLLDGDVLLRDPLPLADRLNQGFAHGHGLPEDSYLALAGYSGEGIVEKINRELQRRFGPKAPKLEVEEDDPAVIVSYAYLDAVLDFRPVFEVLPDPIEFRSAGRADGCADVRGFGINAFSSQSPRHKRLAANVEVVDYRTEQDFIVRLRGLGAGRSGAEVVLARIEPAVTLAETVEMVERRIAAAAPTRLEEGDRLHIPVLRFSLRHSYEELLGRHLTNPGYEAYFFSRALHDVKFTIDETGARLASAAEIRLRKGPAPRRLVFDGPYLLYLKDVHADAPYLAIWVAHPELMVDASS